ncbi:SDR family NAD(P)-dependent oxidoreductase [Marivita sp. S2033]|uniref:SDR family NAD(P)-dependent oxidoreductase n=1 Tax=Marivita sp. S2033 TaxID=3373187 RepID=UPI0039825E88
MPITSASDLSVIITGGAGGIGSATAEYLVERGAQVMITDMNDQAGSELAARLGDRAFFHRQDVTNDAAWRDTIKTAEDKMGKINALFNNAGILGYGGVTDTNAEEFRKIIDINLTGIFLGLHHAAPALKRAGEGVVVNTSSTAGLQGYAGLAAYTASKFGVRGLTKAAALDLAPDNIRVVSIHPGPIATDMTKDLNEDATAGQPIPRIGQAKEVARLVHFLMTEATYSTGCEFVIDGGATVGRVESLT